MPTLASFPGSPSFRAIIPRMTFDPPEGKAEGEPGRLSRDQCHATSPYIRYRRGRTRPRLCLCTLCIVGIAETKNLCVDCDRNPEQGKGGYKPTVQGKLVYNRMVCL